MRNGGHVYAAFTRVLHSARGEALSNCQSDEAASRKKTKKVPKSATL